MLVNVSKNEAGNWTVEVDHEGSLVVSEFYTFEAARDFRREVVEAESAEETLPIAPELSEQKRPQKSKKSPEVVVTPTFGKQKGMPKGEK